MTIEKSVLVPLDADQTFALLTEPERLRRWQTVSNRSSVNCRLADPTWVAPRPLQDADADDRHRLLTKRLNAATVPWLDVEVTGRIRLRPRRAHGSRVADNIRPSLILERAVYGVSRSTEG